MFELLTMFRSMLQAEGEPAVCMPVCIIEGLMVTGCHACRNHLELSEVYPSQHAVSLAHLTMPMVTAVCRGALRALGTPDFHLGNRSVSE